MTDSFNHGSTGAPQDDFDRIIGDLTLEAPTVESQRAYLEQAQRMLSQRLTEAGTYIRVFDSLDTKQELGANWNVKFLRNGNDELYATVQLYNITERDERTTLSKTSVAIIPITARNDVSETPPVGRFTPVDATLLHEYFDTLDAGKKAGMLPNLDGQYEIFDPTTAIMKLGDESTKRSAQPPHES